MIKVWIGDQQERLIGGFRGTEKGREIRVEVAPGFALICYFMWAGSMCAALLLAWRL